jgi:hypothetical protein
MSPALSKAIQDLETKARVCRVTPKQRAIVTALRDVGADSAADTIEDILNRQENAVEDGLETVRYLKRAKPGL